MYDLSDILMRRVVRCTLATDRMSSDVAELSLIVALCVCPSEVGDVVVVGRV
jgi:hypothetical protein